MKIERLILHNFSSFEGNTEFDFRVNEEKNIILIGGKNGAGKTSLFTAVKLGLYGPGAFGYSGPNPRYVQKVKELINYKAFQKQEVEAGVSISLKLTRDRREETYRLDRTWDYSSKRLEEHFTVYRDGAPLDRKEQEYFENYFFTVVPPGIFDLFLFDGEEIGNIFSESSYNTYVKNAIFTMCNLDIFENIRKFSRKYVAKDKGISGQEEKNYEEVLRQIEEEEEKNTRLEAEKKETEEAVELLQEEKEELKARFFREGGIEQARREQLLKEQAEAEKIKTETNGKIKSFVEGDMPFYLVKEFTEKIEDQILYEEEHALFARGAQRLKKESLEALLKSHNITDPGLAEQLAREIRDLVAPDTGEGELLLDLSGEQRRKVEQLASRIAGFQEEEILKCIDAHQQASEKTSQINKILRSAMGEEEREAFERKERELDEKISQAEQKLSELKIRREIGTERLGELDKEREKYFSAILLKAQSQNAYELSRKVERTMARFLDLKTRELAEKLETRTVENLRSILRKNNLITHMEIDEKWQFQLYQNQTYTENELTTLLKNLGTEEFKKQIGNKGIQMLYEKYHADSLNDIRKYLTENWNGEEIELYKKIDMGRLSKGERQIFILSLYWAIIKISGQQIPFIIDTPYARIDARHRKQISEKFFPNISGQVIILSTDEEINREYYKILKPFIANEYLLVNDQSENKTTVEHQYFYQIEEEV